MEKYELYHWGIKGMKWGVRRFQNKDGSLTAAGRKRRSTADSDKGGTEKKKSLLETMREKRGAAQAAKAAKEQAEAEAKEAKAKAEREETRTKLLTSTDAKEIYENRHLLTTNELNERLNRINTEQRLADVANSTKQDGISAVDKMLKIGRKVNEVYEFTNTPVMKAVKSALGITKKVDEVKKSLGLDEVMKVMDTLSDADIKSAADRAKNIEALNLYADRAAARKKEEADAAAERKKAEEAAAEADAEARKSQDKIDVLRKENSNRKLEEERRKNKEWWN